MDRVESEQTIGYYSFDLLQPSLGFESRHLCPISQFLHMYVGFTFSFLTFLADLFHGSWGSALSRIQWMFPDVRQPRSSFYMGRTAYLGRP
jgi:hypothetical protein